MMIISALRAYWKASTAPQRTLRVASRPMSKATFASFNNRRRERFSAESLFTAKAQEREVNFIAKHFLGGCAPKCEVPPSRGN
ncbi:MAG: hypothetical protein ACTS5A_02470 [Candidatus Hodgkinia cicadicola]